MVEMTVIAGHKNSTRQNDKRVTAIVRDLTTGESSSNFTLNLNANCTLYELYKDVGSMASYAVHSFELWWQHTSKVSTTEQLLDADSTQPLIDSELVCDKDDRYNIPVHLILKGKNGVSPIKVNNDEIKYQGWKSYNSIVFRNSLTEDAGKIGYVGLVNHAMTCYLNSLLQTLFMTPEFRNALYKWRFSYSENSFDVQKLKEKCIPYQLQKLFLKMQTSNKRAVETSDVIKSFGWDSSEVWQQHDVQELCRVMFDALEKTFKNTDQADMITQLYQGEMKDYVKCLQCGNESARKDTYQDIPLAVKPFGSDEAYETIEEALKAFVEPELLTGSNQYMCAKCNMKCDAHKGLKFIRFPYLLIIQLKRFAFDYHTLQRIKLNDRVTFPYVLNLTEFLENKVNHEDSVDAFTGCYAEPNTPQLQYELFSIMIHSGSCVGGHYYAYIKSFEDDNWYCFNDQSVTEINEQDIEKAYGGGDVKRYYSSMFASSSNAYMLIYRQIDKSRNSNFMKAAEFPVHIKAAIDNLKEEDEDLKRKMEYERTTCKLKVFGLHPVQKKMVEGRLEVHRDRSLREATQIAHQLLGFEGLVPLEYCRIVKYDSCNEVIDKSYESLEEKAVEEIFENIRPIFLHDLLLDWRTTNQVFHVFKSEDISVKLLEVDLTQRSIEETFFVKVPYASKISNLATIVKERLGLENEDDIRFVAPAYSTFKLLDRFQDVHDYHSRSCKMYIEYNDENDRDLEFNQSKLYEVLDAHFNSITAHIKLMSLDNQKSVTDFTKVIDKRTNVTTFKEFIQPEIGIETSLFKVYRLLGSGTEIEMSSPDETFSLLPSEIRIVIKPGRALKRGDHRVSLYWFDVNSDQAVKFFKEEIVSEDTNVYDFKSRISEEVNKAIGEDIQLSRLRLRKKGNACPGKIYLDDYVFQASLFTLSFTALELFLEILPAPELITSSTRQMPVYVRHWKPSTFTIDPYLEIVLDDLSPKILFEKVAEVSKLKVEDIVVAICQGPFPITISLLDLDESTEWHDITSSKWHSVNLPIVAAFYYKNKNEEVMKLSREKMDDIRRQENMRLYNTKWATTSSRKEKALKIFVDGM